MTTEDDVVAGTGSDVVAAAVTEGYRLDQPDRHRQTRPLRRIRVRRRDASAVADDDVAAVTRGYRVTKATADHDVVATQRGDVVDAARRGGRQALDQVDVRGVGVGAGVPAAARSSRT